MHGCDAAQVWGSHCTFRRTALESIGGHQTGLAEDLNTSLALHAAGWRSVFVPELKARGMVPIDFLGVAKQQFKWARGVFEVLLTTYPRSFFRLSLRQNVAYLLRCTYYLVGIVFLAHCVVAALLLLSGSPGAREAFAAYVRHAAPFAASILLIRMTALAAWERQDKLLDPQWRLYPHTFLLWPFYSLALLCSLLRIRNGHIATPKIRSHGSIVLWVLPQLSLIALLAGSVAFRIWQHWAPPDVVPLLFAGGAAAVQIWALSRALFVFSTRSADRATPAGCEPSNQWSDRDRQVNKESRRLIS
jgi:cellulose synthase/poly-beta-1,6-N-acetylglucosamine synthase-like glycosyltransferase